MTVEHSESGTYSWYPVEPDLTHCVTVRNIDFDLKAERTSEDLNDDDFEAFKSGHPELWQRIVMTIVAESVLGNPPIFSFFETAITFAGVIWFSFGEFEFGRGSPVQGVLDRATAIFHKKSLTKEAGFSVSEDLSSYGAFCLWVCDKSPLVDQMVKEWKPWTSLEERERVFRHYRISADDLGSFHIVCTGAEVKRLNEKLSGESL